jgi:lipopolysaccharide export system protein LptA
MSLFNILLASLIAFSGTCLALVVDSQRPLTIESDRAERNERTGLTQYTGNVIIRQGSLIIDANMVEIESADDRVNRIICTGNPASYQQQSGTGVQVLARAETIEYLPTEKLVNLKTNATLSRNGTLIKGDSINYDVVNETWRAKGDSESNQKRIQLVIPPLNKAEDAANEDVVVEKSNFK